LHCMNLPGPNKEKLTYPNDSNIFRTEYRYPSCIPAASLPCFRLVKRMEVARQGGVLCLISRIQNART
jgi:hypothetical protein